MTRLTLDQACAIVDAALRHGRAAGFAPLSVAVLDAGGHLVAFKREDGSGILRFDVAFGNDPDSDRHGDDLCNRYSSLADGDRDAGADFDGDINGN